MAPQKLDQSDLLYGSKSRVKKLDMSRHFQASCASQPMGCLLNFQLAAISTNKLYKEMLVYLSDEKTFFTLQAYARAVLGLVILSVCPCVTRVDCDKSKWRLHCRCFDTTQRGNHSATLTPTVVGGRHPFPPISVLSDPPPFEKRWLWQISVYNISIIRDNEKSSVMTNIKSTTGFPTSYRCSAYITPKSREGVSQSDFFVFF